MTLQGLAAQKYLNAVLDEGLRIYPVVPGSMPRIVPQDGAIISGQFVPGNVRIFFSCSYLTQPINECRQRSVFT